MHVSFHNMQTLGQFFEPWYINYIQCVLTCDCVFTQIILSHLWPSTTISLLILTPTVGLWEQCNDTGQHQHQQGMRGQCSEGPRERHCRCLFKLGCSVCFSYMFHFYYYYYWKQHRRDRPTRKKVAESEDSEVIVVDWIFSHMNLNILFD